MSAFQAGAETGDLAGIEANGPGQFFIAQFAHIAIGQHVLEGPGKHVGLRGKRAGQIPRIVLLVRMNDSAEDDALIPCYVYCKLNKWKSPHFASF